LNGKVAAPVKKTELTARGSVALTTRHPLSANLALTSPKRGGRSVGIVSLRTKGHGVTFFLVLYSVYSGYLTATSTSLTVPFKKVSNESEQLLVSLHSSTKRFHSLQKTHRQFDAFQLELNRKVCLKFFPNYPGQLIAFPRKMLLFFPF
jgi:hypothetical protein